MASEGTPTKTEAIIVRELNADAFHKRVISLENEGYIARLETYRILADMNPENGIITHVYSIEMYKQSDERAAAS